MGWDRTWGGGGGGGVVAGRVVEFTVERKFCSKSQM